MYLLLGMYCIYILTFIQEVSGTRPFHPQYNSLNMKYGFMACRGTPLPTQFYVKVETFAVKFRLRFSPIVPCNTRVN